MNPAGAKAGTAETSAAFTKMTVDIGREAAKLVAYTEAYQEKLRMLIPQYAAIAAADESSTATRIAALQRLEAAQKKLGVTTMSTGKAMDQLATKSMSLGRTLTRNITVPVIAGLAIAADEFIKFQRNMTMIQTQAGASPGEVKTQSQNILNFAKSGQSPLGPNELSQGLYHLESLGLRGSKALDALKISAQAAGMGIANLEDVTTALGGAVVTGIKGTGDYTKAMGTLNATIGVGNMRMGDLAAAMSTGILPAAKDIGITLPEVGAALAVLTDRGMGAQMAATRLRMTFSMMEAPTAAAQKALADLGISHRQLADDLHKPNGLLMALELLRSGMLSLHDKTRATQDLLDAFGKGRSGAGILTLVGSLDSYVSSYQGKLELIKRKQQEFAEQVAAYHQTAAFKIAAAWSQIRANMIDLGKSVAPAIVAIAQGLSGVVSTFERLPAPVREAVGVAAILFATLGPILLIVGKLGKAWMDAARLAVSAGRLIAGSSEQTIPPTEQAAIAQEQVGRAATVSGEQVQASAAEQVTAMEGAATAAKEAAASQAAVGEAATAAAATVSTAAAEEATAMSTASGEIAVAESKSAGLLTNMKGLMKIGVITIGITTLINGLSTPGPKGFLEQLLGAAGVGWVLGGPGGAMAGITLAVLYNLLKKPSGGDVGNPKNPDYTYTVGRYKNFSVAVKGGPGGDGVAHVLQLVAEGKKINAAQQDELMAYIRQNKNNGSNLVYGPGSHSPGTSKTAKNAQQAWEEFWAFWQDSNVFNLTINPRSGANAPTRNSGTGAAVAGGFVPAAQGVTIGRADQGRDIQTSAGGAIIAPGDGVVIDIKHDPGGGGAHFGPNYPIVEFKNGPYAGMGPLYIGHCRPALPKGAHFKKGDIIAYTASQGGTGINGGAPAGWAEIGFAPGGSPGPMGQQVPFGPGGSISASDYSTGSNPSSVSGLDPSLRTNAEAAARAAAERKRQAALKRAGNAAAKSILDPLEKSLKSDTSTIQADKIEGADPVKAYEKYITDLGNAINSLSKKVKQKGLNTYEKAKLQTELDSLTNDMKKASAGLVKAVEDNIIKPIQQQLKNFSASERGTKAATGYSDKLVKAYRDELAYISKEIDALNADIKKNPGAAAALRTARNDLVNKKKVVAGYLAKALDEQATAIADQYIKTINSNYTSFSDEYTLLSKLSQYSSPTKLGVKLHGKTFNVGGTDLSSVPDQIGQVLGDELTQINTDITDVKSKIASSKGTAKKHYQTELQKLLQDQATVQDETEQNLETVLNNADQAYQTAIQTLDSALQTAEGDVVAQFEQQTQDYIDKLGKKYYQNGLQTPLEKQLAAMQEQDNITSLQQGIADATNQLVQDLSSGADQATIQRDKQAIAQSQRAMQEHELEIKATAQRAKADADYAKAVKQWTDQRTVEEYQLKQDLDAYNRSLENGTGNVSDLNTIMSKYGINMAGVNKQLFTIDFPNVTNAISGKGGLIDTTHNLQSAFNDLITWVNSHTGGNTPTTNPPGNGNGGCFTAETPVLMSDGSEKPIALVEVGDEVMCFDFMASRLVATPVVEVFRHEDDEACEAWVYETEGNSLVGTPDHVVWSGSAWVALGEAETLGSVTDGVQPVLRNRFRAVENVYNLHVEHFDHNYVANGFIVHNVKQALASGGVTHKGRPVLAMIGEGPDQEAVAPLGTLHGMIASAVAAGGGGGGDVCVEVHFDGPVFGDMSKVARELAPALRAELIRTQRRNVTTGIQ